MTWKAASVGGLFHFHGRCNHKLELFLTSKSLYNFALVCVPIWRRFGHLQNAAEPNPESPSTNLAKN